jgi:micrococcal nuclease
MPTMKKGPLALALILLLLLPSLSWAWSGKVVGVTDGDTITVLHEGRGEKIRLYGTDCPEKGQAFGSRAKQATSTLAFGKIAKVEPVDVDQYGQTVAFVRVGHTLVNQELIRRGLAWVYARYCKRPVCEKWRQLEAEAWAKKRGLWADPNPVPPWEFRRQKKKVRDLDGRVLFLREQSAHDGIRLQRRRHLGYSPSG